MNPWQKYVVPNSLAEALRALGSASGSAIPIAGGTDLLLDLEQGRHSPAHTLVDMSRVAEMTVIEARSDQLFIGAAVPLSHVARDPLVLHHAKAVAEACDLIGGPQVRNVATLGGNVAHALPAADGTIALLSLQAVAEVTSLAGRRVCPLSELFLGAGKSALKPGKEVLVGFYVALRKPGQSSCFNRIMRPQGVALPIINVAIWLERSDALIQAIRIAVGPGGPIPWRALEAEQLLAGGAMSNEAGSRALDALLHQVEFRSSPRRGSSEYRRHLVGPLFMSTLVCAWDRAALEANAHGST
jgi:CO/xanthine dehydrogenase FAD-binding subunit